MSLPIFYLASTEEFPNNSTVAGTKAESQDSKNDQGSYHVSVASGDLHWPPVLTPSDFSTPPIVQTSDRTDHTDRSFGYRELTDVANSHLQSEITGIATSATGPTRTATPTLLPSLQSLPSPALYQCSSCGQLNPIAPFAPRESGDSSSYSLPTLAEISDFQDGMENRWKRQKRN